MDAGEFRPQDRQASIERPEQVLGPQGGGGGAAGGLRRGPSVAGDPLCPEPPFTYPSELWSGVVVSKMCQPWWQFDDDARAFF